MKQIIDPLKNVKLVLLAIVAYIITLVLPLDESLRIVLMQIPLAIALFILMPIAGEIGKRSQAT